MMMMTTIVTEDGCGDGGGGDRDGPGRGRRSWPQAALGFLVAFGLLAFVALVTSLVIYAAWLTLDEVVDRQREGLLPSVRGCTRIPKKRCP